MATSTLITAVHKLAIAGESAGFSIEQMMALLNAGLTVESLLGLIEKRLATLELSVPPVAPNSSRWVM
jgi:hypothetical protein